MIMNLGSKVEALETALAKQRKKFGAGARWPPPADAEGNAYFSMHDRACKTGTACVVGGEIAVKHREQLVALEKSR